VSGRQSPRERPLFDANAVIRMVLGDDAAAFEAAWRLFESRPCLVPVEVIAEVVYNLRSKYGLSRREIASRLKDFILLRDDMVPEPEVLRFALNLFAATTLDFVDCLLTGYAKVKGHRVFSFDRDLNKRLGEMAVNAAAP